MVFLRLSFHSGKINTVFSDSDDQQQWRSTIQRVTGLPGEILTFPRSQLSSLDANVEVGLANGLVGGKGGFGSMLRALGAQIEKTTNREACRDLSGRRLRDINEEERLKRYIAKRAEREREAAERAAAKKAKLERIVKEEYKPELKKGDKFEEQREKCIEGVHDAVDAYLAKTNNEDEQSKDVASSEPKPTTSGSKRAASDRDLWLGVNLSDSDLESSSDEDETEQPPSKVVKAN